MGHGNPQIYYNVHADEERSHVGELFVQIAHFDSNETPALLDAIRAELGVYPRAQLRLESFRNGPPLDAPIVVRVFAEDLGVLRGLSARVAEQIASVPGTLYIDDPLRVTKTDLAVRVDAEQAGRLGVPEIEVKNGVRLAIAGLLAGKLRDSDGEEYPIRVTLQQGEGGRAQLDALDDLTVTAASGAHVPLRQLASLEFEASPSEIAHYGKRRSATVSAHTVTGFNIDKVTDAVIEKLDAMEWPPGTGWRTAGERENREESFGGFGAAILIASFGVLAVLVLEFRTFKSTGIVASVIPLGIAGGILALWRHRQLDLVHRDDRLHRADRHRGEELDPAGGLHEPAARAGRRPRRRHRTRRPGPLLPDPVDDDDRHRRPAAARVRGQPRSIRRSRSSSSAGSSAPPCSRAW